MKLKEFFSTELWRTTGQDFTSWWKRLVYNTLKTIILTIRGFTNNDLAIKANGLTYSLMFAVVPILAMVLAIAKGFGFDEVISAKLNDSFLGELNMVDTLMGFVERYLDTAQGGVFIGVGILILIWAVYAFFRNVEREFNDIWDVQLTRSIGRQLTNYLMVLFLIPIMIVVTSGLSVLMNSAAGAFMDYALLRKLQTGLGKFLSFVVVWGIFTWIYKAIPNTKVRLVSAAIPGILIGTLFQVLEMVSVYFIVFLGRTSVVYGAFASIPLLMMWLQISCLLMLIGAEISFAIQNNEEFEYEKDIQRMSRRYKDMIMLYLLHLIIERFRHDDKPYTLSELAHTEHLPVRIVSALTSRLVEVGILREIYMEGVEERTFQPAMDVALITKDMVLERINRQGEEGFLNEKAMGFTEYWKKNTAEVEK